MVGENQIATTSGQSTTSSLPTDNLHTNSSLFRGIVSGIVFVLGACILGLICLAMHAG